MTLKIEDYIPHRPPMILLSRILEVTDAASICEVTITEDSLFFEDGQVPGWVGIEYMAQTIAVYGGYLGKKVGEDPVLGFLLGARKYNSHKSGFPAGSRLVIRAEPALTDGDMSCFNAQISLKDTVVAESTIMTYKANDEFLKQMGLRS